MKISLRWITPKADEEIGYIARVSNPKAKPEDSVERLLQYLLKHKHFSPFEMACMCVEIETTRDIARQILRHRSFHFQEFSQRYSIAPEEPELSVARLQDPKNRQNSIPTDDDELLNFWENAQWSAFGGDMALYRMAIEKGIAKELARKLLPEGLTRTRMYMQGTIRDWLHYIGIRAGTETQLEHRQIAMSILSILKQQCPLIYDAAYNARVVPGVYMTNEATS